MQLGLPELIFIILLITLIFGSERIFNAFREVPTIIKSFQKDAGKEGLASIGELSKLSIFTLEDIQLNKEVEDLRDTIGVLKLLKNRLTVFISSTMADLSTERQVVASSVEELFATKPWLFEDNAGPESQSPKKIYLDAVKNCNVFILIIGSKISDPVKEEYKVAKKERKPILVFVKKCKKPKEVDNFLNVLSKDGITWTEFSSTQELGIKVKGAIVNHIVSSYLEYGLSKRHSVVLALFVKQLEDVNLLYQRKENLLLELKSNPDDKEIKKKVKELEKHLGESEAEISNKISIKHESLASLYFKKGHVALSNKDYPVAIRMFTFCIFLEPGTERYYQVRANAYSGSGHSKKAIYDLLDVLKINPKNTDARHSLAYLYDKIGENKKTEEQFREIIAINKITGLKWRASYYKKEFMYSSAIEDYTSLIFLEPKNYFHYISRGDAYFEFSDYKSALADYDYAIGIDSDSSSGYIQRGKVFRAMDRYADAIRDFTKAIDIKPFGYRYIYRAEVYFDINEYDMALKDANNAIDVSPKSSQAFRCRAKVLKALGDPISAAFDLETANNLDKN